MTSVRLVVCEGLSDVYFWEGWLRKLGAEAPDAKERNRTAPKEWLLVKECHLLRLAKGANVWIALKAAGADTQVTSVAQAFANEPDRYALSGVVLNRDADDSAASVTTALQQALAAMPSHPNITLRDIVVWHAPDAPAPGLPRKEELERLGVAALHEVYPGRGEALEHWLNAEPRRTPEEGAAHAAGFRFTYAHLSKWRDKDVPYGAWLRALWENDDVAKALERRLRATGAWSIAEALLAPTL